MGIFGSPSPFDEDVEKATSPLATTEDWGLIMEICDRVVSGSGGGGGGAGGAARACLRAVMRRLAHADPHVALHAATLLDACVANCGRAFLLEVASRDFDAEYRRVLAAQRSQPAVTRRMRALLRKWALNEFRDDPQLALIPALHMSLRDTSDVEVTPAMAAANAAAAAASVAQREREELARAIEMSLREAAPAAAAAAAAATASLYPSVEAPPPQPPPARQVRALYDFEAAEDNELTFMAGEIVHVTDSSDPNWWKGYNHRGEGLLPANFVTSDLSVSAAEVADSAAAGGASGAAAGAAESGAGAGEEEGGGGIDEEVLERALALLGEAGAERAGPEEAALLALERRAGNMQAGVDAALQRADRAHATLSRLGGDLVDALNLYHELMRAPPHAALPPPHALPPHPHAHAHTHPAYYMPPPP